MSQLRIRRGWPAADSACSVAMSRRPAVEPEGGDAGGDRARRHDDDLVAGARAAAATSPASAAMAASSMAPRSSVTDDVPIFTTSAHVSPGTRS